MVKLILIRHGETDWNVEGRWQGQIDLPLNSKGKEQAEQIAKSLENTKIHAIYTSDLQRAVETANAIGRLQGLKVQSDPRLREIHQGEWQGLLVSEIKERYAEVFYKRHKNPLAMAPPGGETGHEVYQRITQAIQDIVQKHPNETVAIVSHGFAIAVMLIYLKGIAFERAWDFIPDNASIQTFETLK